MRGQRENFRKAVQSFEIKKRKIDIYGNYEANGVEKNQRKFEIFSTLISKKSTERKRDAGASWTIWAAAVLVAEFQSTEVPGKKLYLIARPTNDIHYLWPLELKILDGKLIKPKTYYFDEESVQLSNCNYEELLSFLSKESLHKRWVICYN